MCVREGRRRGEGEGGGRSVVVVGGEEGGGEEGRPFGQNMEFWFFKNSVCLKI